MKLKIPIPEIPESEKTPLVLTLLTIIEHQANIIDQLNEEVQLLKDEIARLEGQNPKPKIRPSRLESSKSKKSKSPKKKRPGSKKRSKASELEIHHTQYVEPENIPSRSI